MENMYMIEYDTVAVQEMCGISAMIRELDIADDQATYGFD